MKHQNVKLYKFTPSLEIAEKVSVGIFRFYELTKYIKIEDTVGRADSAEGSISFHSEEYMNSPEKLPVGSFNNVEFSCVSINRNEDYLRQFFIFCMSTDLDKKAISDSEYAVELYKEVFELLSQHLNEPYEGLQSQKGTKFFSHGEVQYYDINNHPKSIEGKEWRSIYSKHSKFKEQDEYRAAFFASDHFFNRVKSNTLTIKKEIYGADKKRLNFDLEFYVRSGIDDEGYRFLEIDVSTLNANIGSGLFTIIELAKIAE